MSLKDLDDPDIVKLNVVLHTNKDTNSKISLTAKLFTFDKSQTLTGEYPFLCTNVEYNADYFTDKPTFEKVQIFFNRKEFDKLVALSGAPLKEHTIKEGDRVEVTKITEGNVLRQGKIYGDNRDNTYIIKYNDGETDVKVSKENIRLIDSQVETKKVDIVRINILLMLNIMFPISFPVNDNVSSLLNKSKQFDFMSLFKTIVSSGEYSYLNIDKPSTVIQVVWLDTITSNPVYIELYEAFKNYKKKLIEYAVVKSKRADPINISGIQKELTKFYKDYISTYKSTERRKHKNVYEHLDKLFKTKEKEYNHLSNRVQNLNDQIDILKQMSNKFLQNPETKLIELEEIAKKLNVDESAEKKTLERLISQYKAGTSDENEFKKGLEDYQTRSSSTWWKIYFMLSRFKKNTSDYNEFIDKYVATYVAKFTDNDTPYWAYNNSRSAIEAKFLKSTSDLEFYFNFLKKIEQFIPSYRKSLSMDISPLLGDEDNRYAINIDDYLKLYKDKKKNADASIDVIRPSKKTRSENEVDETKNDYYEIHLGVAVVGGKVDASTDVWCYYNSIKLANDFSTIYDSIKLASTKQEAIDMLSLYPYVDLETKIAEAKGKMPVSKMTLQRSPLPKKPPLPKRSPVQTQMPPIQTKKKGGSKKGARKTLRLKK